MILEIKENKSVDSYNLDGIEVLIFNCEDYDKEILIPSEIKSVELHTVKFNSIIFNSNLEEVLVNNYYSERLDLSLLPDSVKSLYIADKYLYLEYLPKNLEELTLEYRRCLLLDERLKYPKSLKKLEIKGYLDVNNFNFPENLEELIIDFDLDETEVLPESLKKLVTRGYLDVNNYNFPENLEELVIDNEDDLEEIKVLPENLKVLDLHVIYNGDLDKLKERYPDVNIISIDDNERQEEEIYRKLGIFFSSLLENNT